MSWVSRSLGFYLFVAMWVLVSGEARAEKEPKVLTAHEVVQEVTTQILRVIKGNKETISEDPQQYYTEVQAVLDPVVDFRFIANGVMGAYAKQAAPEQRKRFTSTFRRGFVTTFAKGMAGFGDRNIVVVPPEGDLSRRRTVSVTQEVQGQDGVNRVSYTMKRKRSGEWKLVNVVLNGVNLGKTFRSQFAQAMKKNGGDLNSVIEGWSGKQYAMGKKG